MAKKKKFTVRVAYKVYEYYDVEATSEERAIEKALEQSSEDSLNDFIQEGEGEGLVTIIDGKPVEYKKPEPKPIWVLFAESLYDYEIVRRVINVFENEGDARKAFAEEVKEARKCATTNEWVIGNDNENFFEAYPDGSWGTSHETVELNQTVMNEKITCRN